MTGRQGMVLLAAVSIALVALFGGWMPSAAADGTIITRLQANGAVVRSLGVAHGLEGFEVRPVRGGPYTLYVTPDGAAVLGHLFDREGVSVSAGQLTAAHGGDRERPAASALAERPARRTSTAADRQRDEGAEPADRSEDARVGQIVAEVRKRWTAQRQQHAALLAEVERTRAATSGPADRISPPSGLTLAGLTRVPGDPESGPVVDGNMGLLLAERAQGIRLAAGNPEVHVFADPGCSHSRRFVERLRAEAGGQNFGVRVIPVALLGSWSAYAAVWVLEQPDRAAAWDKVRSMRLGPEDVGQTGAHYVAGNNAALKHWRGVFVPFSVFRNTSGGVRVLDGLPDHLGHFVREVTRREFER